MAFVSCVGFSGTVSFRSRGCSLALEGMAPVCGVTLSMQAGMGAVPGGPLTLVGAGTARGGGILGACNPSLGGGSDLLSARLVRPGALVTPSSRKAIFACRATGLDYPPFDPTVTITLPKLLHDLAKQTLLALDRVDLPKPDDEKWQTFSREIGAIRARCQELDNELAERRISFHPAAIKLEGLHARIVTLFTFGRVEQINKFMVAAPNSLEQFTSETLSQSMSKTLDFYNKLQKQPNKRVCELTTADEADMTLSKLLVILGQKTSHLLDEIPLILLPSKRTLGVTMRPSWELEELQVICHKLNKEMGAPGFPDHVAVGTLLGLHRRIADILSTVNERPQELPGILQSVYKRTLVNSMSEVDQGVMEYLKKPEKGHKRTDG